MPYVFTEHELATRTRDAAINKARRIASAERAASIRARQECDAIADAMPSRDEWERLDQRAYRMERNRIYEAERRATAAKLERDTAAAWEAHNAAT